MRKRATLNNQLQKTDNHHRKNALATKFFAIENETKSSHERQSDEEENKAVSNIKQNPKFFSSTARNSPSQPHSKRQQ